MSRQFLKFRIVSPWNLIIKAPKAGIQSRRKPSAISTSSQLMLTARAHDYIKTESALNRFCIADFNDIFAEVTK